MSTRRRMRLCRAGARRAPHHEGGGVRDNPLLLCSASAKPARLSIPPRRATLDCTSALAGQSKLLDQKVSHLGYLVEIEKGRPFTSDGVSPATAMMLLSSGASGSERAASRRRTSIFGMASRL